MTDKRLPQRKTRPYRAVALDYGMVLCHKPTPQQIDRIARVFGVSHDAFWTLYEKNRGLYDRGDLTPAQYWIRFAEDTGATLDDTTMEWLQNWDIEMWSSAVAPMMDWARRLRATGYKTAILSNLHQRFAWHLRRHAKWLQTFDCQIFSSEVRLTKPDSRIFQLCVERLGVEGQEVLFVDDREVNVRAAERAGMTAICFHSVRGLRDDLDKVAFDVLP
jgi:putative hydrolase of the HAD superfamily